MDEPYYVGSDVGGLHLGLDPSGHAQGMTGPAEYWHVADVRQTLAEVQVAGAEVYQDAEDVGGGKLIATVRDGAGNVIGLRQTRDAVSGQPPPGHGTDPRATRAGVR
jgi:predicted enzyme related to lactoylglutathione lyase